MTDSKFKMYVLTLLIHILELMIFPNDESIVRRAGFAISDVRQSMRKIQRDV